MGARENCRRYGVALPAGFDERLVRRLRLRPRLPPPRRHDPGAVGQRHGRLPRAARAGRAAAGPAPSCARCRPRPRELPRRRLLLPARERTRYLIFDCGPLGDGGHGHYDLLSVEAWDGAPAARARPRPLHLRRGRRTAALVPRHGGAQHGDASTGATRRPTRAGAPREPAARAGCSAARPRRGSTCSRARRAAPLRRRPRAPRRARRRRLLGDRGPARGAHAAPLRPALPSRARAQAHVVAGGAVLGRDARAGGPRRAAGARGRLALAALRHPLRRARRHRRAPRGARRRSSPCSPRAPRRRPAPHLELGADGSVLDRPARPARVRDRRGVRWTRRAADGRCSGRRRWAPMTAPAFSRGPAARRLLPARGRPAARQVPLRREPAGPTWREGGGSSRRARAGTAGRGGACTRASRLALPGRPAAHLPAPAGRRRRPRLRPHARRRLRRRALGHRGVPGRPRPRRRLRQGAGTGRGRRGAPAHADDRRGAGRAGPVRSGSRACWAATARW